MSKGRVSHRICPDCEIRLDTIMIDEKEKCYIEKCQSCQGIFLDFGELEHLMKKEIFKSENHAEEMFITLMQEPILKEEKVKYRKCPECRKFMARINYRKKSRVIIDRCMHCGIWLEIGELAQIITWAKKSGIKEFKPIPEKKEKVSDTSLTPHYLRTPRTFRPFKREMDVDPLSLSLLMVFGL